MCNSSGTIGNYNEERKEYAQKIMYIERAPMLALRHFVQTLARQLHLDRQKPHTRLQRLPLSFLSLPAAAAAALGNGSASPARGVDGIPR